MTILLQSAGITTGILLVIILIMLFGSGEWIPQGKPSKEVMVILAVLLFLVLMTIGLAVWEYNGGALYPASVL